MYPKKSGRYAVPSSEDFEPDSKNEVLKNYLGIKSSELINDIEQRELERTELKLFEIYDSQHQFTTEDICYIHELWLGNVYPSAGKYRTVTINKNGFSFAISSQITKLMIELENNYLSRYTPCHFDETNELAYALAVVHIELILIHPFREGNGRTARLLTDLMAAQANKPPLNYSFIDQTKNPKGFEQYISAIHAGVLRDYKPIHDIFITLLDQSV